MSTIKGYTYIPKLNDNNSFDLAIWDELQKGALSNHGKAFSFKLQFVTEKRHFRPEYGFWSSERKWVHRGTDRYDRLERFKSYASNYTSKLSLSLNETCFSDTRTPLSKYTTAYKAEAEYGYIATFDVPEEYSQEIYNTYALEAIPFCNQLLSQHGELLSQMTKNLLDEDGVGGTKEGSLFVSSDGVYNGRYRGNSDGWEYKKFFADFGRPPLASVQQCYGFVLALIEIHGHWWKLFGTPKLEVSVYHGEKLRADDVKDDFVAIKLHYRTDKEKPVLPLKPW